MHYIGFNSGEFARAGNALALSECNVKYMRPLRTRDLFNSLAWVTKVSATSFHLYQELVKVEEDEQACREEVGYGLLLYRSTSNTDRHKRSQLKFRDVAQLSGLLVCRWL